MTNSTELFDEIRELIVSARRTVAHGVDLVQVYTNFEIGRRIVQEEQRGEDRAAYGQELLRSLAARLTGEFGKGFSHTNLKLMRQFYLQNRQRISQNASDQSLPVPTIGIVLCKQKSKALVEITLPQDANIHAQEYQLYLPSKEDLRQQLIAWAGDA